MKKQKIYIGTMFRYLELEYDKLYYIKSINGAIGRCLDGLEFRNKDFKKCVNFIENNSNILIFLKGVVDKNIEPFKNKKTADKLIYDYARKLFNIADDNAEILKQINKDEIAKNVFSSIIYDSFLKVKPLTEDLENKIYEVI